MEWIYIVVASVLSFVCMVILGRRILLLTVVVLLLYTACKKNIINRNSAFKVIIFVSLIAIIWIFDVFQLRSSILESTLITRILEDGTESGRLVRMSYFISHFFEHMYGGKYIFQAVGYSHNFWLDIFDYVGIVPFLIMIIINVNFIVKAYKIQKNNLLGKGDGYLISTITIVTLIQFFTEPAYFSQIVFVWVYVILSGGAIILSKSNTIPFSSKRIN